MDSGHYDRESCSFPKWMGGHMKTLSGGRGVVLALGMSAAGIAAVAVACSGGGSNSAANAENEGGIISTPSDTDSGAGGAAPTSADAGAPAVANAPTDAGAVSLEAGTCSSPTIPIIFAPMYSAFIPGSTAETFAIPAVMSDGNAATWSLSDPSQGNLQLEAFESAGALIPGVLISL